MQNATDPSGMPEDVLFFDYRFEFEDGSKKGVRIHLDPDTLRYLPERALKGDDWTRLDFHQCETCPLDPRKTPDCPIALSIEDLVAVFRDKFSYEAAKVAVHSNDRTYLKETTLQKGLSSILGILMVSSGCPIMAKLRPMVRLHLPFSSVMETTLKTTGTYLLGQFLLKQKGRPADFSLEGLREIYRNVGMVNRGMARRIQEFSGKDASINALIILDIFALNIPLSLEAHILEIEPFFSPYFEDAAGGEGRGMSRDTASRPGHHVFSDDL